MRRPLLALATVGLAAVALAGCHRTPANFGPIPVGYQPGELEPGLWAAQGMTDACLWQIAQGTATITGAASAVTLPAGTGITFRSAGCGQWQYVNGGEGRS